MNTIKYDFKTNCAACDSHTFHIIATIGPSETEKTVTLKCPECDVTRTMTLKRASSNYPISGVKDE